MRRAFHIRHHWKSGLISLAFSICFQVSAYAIDVTLRWDANHEPDIAGHKIHYKPGASGGPKLENYNGKDAGEGVSPIEVLLADDENPDPNVLEFTVHGLDDDKNYYLVVTAYDTEGKVSFGSREIKVFGSDDIQNPRYNKGWAVTSGEFKGFEVLYHTDHVQTSHIGTIRRN